jgi:hypothetical protein
VFRMIQAEPEAIPFLRAPGQETDVVATAILGKDPNFNRNSEPVPSAADIRDCSFSPSNRCFQIAPTRSIRVAVAKFCAPDRGGRAVPPALR